MWLIVLSVAGVALLFSALAGALHRLGYLTRANLSPLWPSHYERAYQREVGGREALTDEEFYARFYEGSGIPRDIPAKVRRCLASQDLHIEKAYPSDVIGYAYDDLDFYDVIFRVEKAFDIQFDKGDDALFTGTLGNLIARIHEELGRRKT